MMSSATPAAMTPYPEVNAMVATLLDGARAALRAPAEGIPYPNARPHLRIAPEDLDDPGQMSLILSLTVTNLPKKPARRR